MIRNISFDINNGQQLILEQEKHDHSVLVYHVKTDLPGLDKRTSEIKEISPGQFIMLLNLYWYIIDNDIQNDFINVCGKNKEEQ